MIICKNTNKRSEVSNDWKLWPINNILNKHYFSPLAIYFRRQ